MMTPYEWAQLLSSLGGTAVIVARMRNYVTVDEYRAKIAALHSEINMQGKQLAVQDERIRHLDERK